MQKKIVHDRMFRIIYSFSFRMDDEGFFIRQMYVYKNNKKLRQKKEERKQHMVQFTNMLVVNREKRKRTSFILSCRTISLTV